MLRGFSFSSNRLCKQCWYAMKNTRFMRVGELLLIILSCIYLEFVTCALKLIDIFDSEISFKIYR